MADEDESSQFSSPAAHAFTFVSFDSPVVLTRDLIGSISALLKLAPADLKSEGTVTDLPTATLLASYSYEDVYPRGENKVAFLEREQGFQKAHHSKPHVILVPGECPEILSHVPAEYRYLPSQEKRLQSTIIFSRTERSLSSLFLLTFLYSETVNAADENLSRLDEQVLLPIFSSVQNHLRAS